MNVELNYKAALFRFDVNPSHPISYIEELVVKVFNLTKEKIYLYFNDQRIVNSSVLIGDFFANEDKVSLRVEGLENLCSPLIPELKSNAKIWKSLNKRVDSFNPKSHDRTKTTALQSQDSLRNTQCNNCKSRDCEFYCRLCTVFYCGACKATETAHLKHKVIRIEKGNIRQSTLIYKRDLINDIKQIGKDLRESNSINIDEEIITTGVNDIALLIKKIIAKKNDIVIQIPSCEVKDPKLDSLMSKIYSLYPNDDFFNESMEATFKMMSSYEKELNCLQDEIGKIKVKHDFREIIYASIKNINKVLEKTFNDINGIYQNSMGSKSNLLMEMQKFLNENGERNPKEKPSHIRLQSYSNYDHIALPLPILSNKTPQMQKKEFCAASCVGSKETTSKETSGMRNYINEMSSRDETVGAVGLKTKPMQGYVDSELSGFSTYLKTNRLTTFNSPTKVFNNNINQLKKKETSQLVLKGPKKQESVGLSKSIQFTEPNESRVRNESPPKPTSNNLRSSSSRLTGLINADKANPTRLFKKKKNRTSRHDLI